MAAEACTRLPGCDQHAATEALAMLLTIGVVWGKWCSSAVFQSVAAATSSHTNACLQSPGNIRGRANSPAPAVVLRERNMAAACRRQTGGLPPAGSPRCHEQVGTVRQERSAHSMSPTKPCARAGLLRTSLWPCKGAAADSCSLHHAAACTKQTRAHTPSQRTRSMVGGVEKHRDGCEQAPPRRR
jgi:hypothetical protein